MSIKIAAISLPLLAMIGTGGVFLHKHLNKVTVKQSLQNEVNLKILDDSSSTSEWKSIINDNSETNKKEKLKIFIKSHNPSIEGLEGEVTEEQLKSSCKSALESQATIDKVNETKAYCTRAK